MNYDDAFNPTMVRLLPCKLVRVRSNMRFQSHNGAIAASRRGEQREGLTADFQSHNGAIAAFLYNREVEPRVVAFNPTMVRLLLATCSKP